MCKDYTTSPLFSVLESPDTSGVASIKSTGAVVDLSLASFLPARCLAKTTCKRHAVPSITEFNTKETVGLGSSKRDTTTMQFSGMLLGALVGCIVRKQ